MKDVTSNMTIAIIMDCLDCCEVEYSLTKTKGSHFSPGSPFFFRLVFTKKNSYTLWFLVTSFMKSQQYLIGQSKFESD